MLPKKAALGRNNQPGPGLGLGINQAEAEPLVLESENKPPSDPPTPLRPSVVANLLNLRYRKPKSKPVPRKPKWQGVVPDLNETAGERGEWLYQQEPKEEPDVCGATLGTKAILEHDRAVSSRSEAELAAIRLHKECCLARAKLDAQDTELLGWAERAQADGELDAMEYMSRLREQLKARTALDHKLSSTLAELEQQLETEEQAAATVACLLNA